MSSIRSAGRLLAVAAMVGSAFLAPIASADDLGPGDKTPVDVQEGALPLTVCSFPVTLEVVSKKEYYVKETTLEDGTTIKRATGKLVVKFTHESDVPGAPIKSIIKNFSGPYTETERPDGTRTFEGQGPSYFVFGPRSQAATGQPGLVFTSGAVVVDYSAAPVIAERFSLSGTQQNGCSLLS